jgi:hypothetical protein
LFFNLKRQKWFGFLDNEYYLMMHRPVEEEYISKKVEKTKVWLVASISCLLKEKTLSLAIINN